MVHHSDVNVDATTGTRHHPVDYTRRLTFRDIFSAAMGFGAHVCAESETAEPAFENDETSTPEVAGADLAAGDLL